MKILEIHGFTTWANDYEGEHEVIRWLPRNRHKDESGQGKLGEACREGFSLFGELSTMDVDLIVCAAFGRSYGRGGAFHQVKAMGEKQLVRMVTAMKERAGAPLAIVDITDDLSVHPVNRGLLDSCDCYFKRELPLDVFHSFEALRSPLGRASSLKDRLRPRWQGWAAKMAPVPLGCREIEPRVEPIPLAQREWDVFYAGNDIAKPRRTGVEDAVRSLADLGFKVWIPEKALSIDEYLAAMGDARITVSPPGLGWDCHRHYEAAFVGTVPVTPFPIIQRHAPLLGGEHCVFYDPEKDLAMQLAGILRDEPTLERISESGWEHARENLTHAAIFSYVIEETLRRAGGL